MLYCSRLGLTCFAGDEVGKLVRAGRACGLHNTGMAGMEMVFVFFSPCIVSWLLPLSPTLACLFVLPLPSLLFAFPKLKLGSSSASFAPC
jgi:hypothetical protein